ncbi:MAG TPA: DUF523 and DUF1722 domain-containing protein [Gammaproteobacteria bacterium]|nr:DUF523 and DUF1722 domain-containing protein [Gammaproteobacteria bacterium]
MDSKQDTGHTPGGRIRVGVSSCLLGESVRYDSGHKQNRYITQILGRFFEFVPACPEVAIGLGVPRPPIRLRGDPGRPRAVGVTDSTFDVTDKLDEYARSRVETARGLSGYIFKRGSPSCGMERVKVFDSKGMPSAHGAGIFARRLMEELPLMPVEEEGRLTDPVLRENFITRIYVYYRWQHMREGGITSARMVEFHTRHKMLVRAHGEAGYQRLGRLVAEAGTRDLSHLAEEYLDVLMRTIKQPATRKQHSNVLSHLAGYLKRDIDAGDRAELVRLIDEYRLGRVPLVVPVTMLKHHFRRCPDPYVGHQFYLEPHPEELQLRNYI